MQDTEPAQEIDNYGEFTVSLCDIVTTHGIDVVTKYGAWLRMTLGDRSPRTSVLNGLAVASVRAGIPNSLRLAASAGALSLAIDHAITRLAMDQWCDEATAADVVRAWAIALKLVPLGDFVPRQRRRNSDFAALQSELEEATERSARLAAVLEITEADRNRFAGERASLRSQNQRLVHELESERAESERLARELADANALAERRASKRLEQKLKKKVRVAPQPTELLPALPVPLRLVTDADLRPNADLRPFALKGINVSGRDLSGVKLAGSDLSGANLAKTNLRGADLSGADLSGAKLFNANLSEADLSRTNIRSANFSYAKIEGTNLSHATAQLAVFRHAKMKNANLSSGDFQDSDWFPESIYRVFKYIMYVSYIIFAVSMLFTWIYGVIFGCTLGIYCGMVVLLLRRQRTILTNARLTNANLAGAKLTLVDFQNADLTGAVMTGAKLGGAEFEGAIGLPLELRKTTS